MVYRTFGDLKLQVEQEIDIEGEEFIQEQEIKNYFNSAIVLCEAYIVKLGVKNKYLQDEFIFSTVPGVSDYPLPPDIIINQLRKVTYRSPTSAYTLKAFNSEHSYAYEDMISGQNTSSEWYNYQLYKKGNVQVMRLTPTPQLAGVNSVRMIYFKSLQKYVNDADLCDLPDICYEYVMSFVRYRVYAKESHSNTGDEKQNMQALMALMQETMQSQTADPDIEQNDGDLSHYMEMN